MSDPILPLAVWEEGTLQNDVPANDNSLRLEALSREVLGTEDSPTSTNDGDVFIVGGSPSGDFATFDPDDLTIYRGGNWYAWAPVDGVVVNVAGSLFTYSGSSGWVGIGGGGGAVDSVNGQTGAVVLSLDDLDDVDAAAPSDGDVLTWDSVASEWVAEAPTGGGLTNWTDGLNSSGINASVPVASLTATNAATNVDAVFAAKGAGATAAQVADGTTTGGNKRGVRATDWQKSRSAAAQAATADYAAIGGGRNNTASSQGATVSGGETNAATGADSSIGGGSTNTASATNATVCGGSGNTASATYSTCVGGSGNVASGTYSTAMGDRATTRSISGAVARASGGLGNSVGDGQSLALVLTVYTNNTTPTVMKTNSAAAGANNQYRLENGTSAVVRGTVVARHSGGDTSTFEFVAAIKRGANAASTAMVAACTPVVVAADAGASTWALTVDADTTNGALRVSAVGEAGRGIYWVCDLYSIVEVKI